MEQAAGTRGLPRPGAATAGHCERPEAAGIVSAVSAAAGARASRFDLRFLHPF